MIGPDRDDGMPRIELHPETLDDDDRRYLSAWVAGRNVARMAVEGDQGRLRVLVDDGAATVPEREALIGSIVALAASEHLQGVVLAAGSSLLLRYAAREAGFFGPLRGDLVRDLRTPLPLVRREQLQEGLLLELSSLLPQGVIVSADRRAGVLRSWIRTASAGVAGTVHLTARDVSDAEPLRLAVPVGSDVLIEGIALTIDTALAIRRRFHPLVDEVRIFYDQSLPGLRTGSVAGAAYSSVRDIHLSPAYASAAQMAAQPGQYHERQPSRTILPPLTPIDSVVAHEYGHQIEFGLESGRYRDSVDFRRALGGYFGVETLEHVIKGGERGAPAAWQAARVRLAEEVSAYATTAPKEATAELFAQWWCTAPDPPPTARYFGEVVDRFFPPR